MNEYSNPAQAQFINTYVPIPFEQLYNLGLQAKQDVEKAVEKVLAAGYRTGDMMQDGLSRCSTSEMAEKVLAELQ